jgi:hypothetical protein
MQKYATDDAQEAIDKAVSEYGPQVLDAIEKDLGGPAALSQVYSAKEAPEAVAAQKSALARLQQISEKGYTPEEQAALNRIQQQTAAQASQQQAALRSQMVQRGNVGSGAELAMNLAGLGQQSAQQYQAGLDVAANAQRRALQGLQGVGSMAGQMREQGFGEASRRAGAEDERRRLHAGAITDYAGNVLRAKTGQAQTGYEMERNLAAIPAGAGSAIGTGLINYGSLKKKE